MTLQRLSRPHRPSLLLSSASSAPLTSSARCNSHLASGKTELHHRVNNNSKNNGRSNNNNMNMQQIAN